MKRILFAICICFFLGSNINAQTNTKNKSLSKIFEATDAVSSDYISQQKAPIIGISASNSRGASRLSGAYVEAVLKAGGTPVIIPVMTDAKAMREIIAGLDGIVFSGGGDIQPAFFGQDSITNTLDVDRLRDEYEFKLLKIASDRNVPILGICRGQQLINVAFGGTLYQDIPLQHTDKSIKHLQSVPREQASHDVSLVPDSQLAAIFDNATTLSVNSIHHQSVKDVAPGFKAVAIATDGIVEGIEAYPDRSIIAVQWHPEAQLAGGNEVMLKLFDFFIQKADIFRQAKELHKRILSVDTHCDTPLCFKNEGFNIFNRDSNQVNLPKMEEGKLDAVFMAAYIRQGARDAASSQKAVKHVTGLIEGIHDQATLNKALCEVAYTANDLIRLKAEGKKAIFIGIENGYGIGKDIKNLERYKKLGVNYMTLCHTVNNDICDTSTKRSKKEWGGLSPFGRDVIKEMNRLGIIVDLSHTGENTFWDVMELSTQPVVATHSSVRAICEHDRNLTDDQLRAIANKNGVVQLCPVDIFVNSDSKKASLTDFMEHIDYAVRVAGINHVGIGSDFDGGGELIGLRGANDLINITVKLIEKGYSEEDIAKIWGGNFLRVLNDVQSAAGL